MSTIRCNYMFDEIANEIIFEIKKNRQHSAYYEKEHESGQNRHNTQTYKHNGRHMHAFRGF